MRRILMIILVAGFISASCGDDATTSSGSTSTPAGSTTTAEVTTTQESTTTAEATTTTTTEPTTTTAPPPGAYQVDAIETCVIGSTPGSQVNVRSGPGSGFDIVASLAEDATGVHTTGWAMEDSGGGVWRQITLGQETPWVFSAFLTQGACTLGTPTDYCSNEAACTDVPNVRTGLGIAYDVVATLPRNAANVAGTGATTQDDHGRTWVQVRYQGDVGWVAGWLLTAEPCSPTTCVPPALPWLITAGGVGPIAVGGSIGDLDYLTGLTWNWQEPGAEDCLWAGTPSMDLYLQADEGTVVDGIWVEDPAAAITAAGIRVGDTRNELNTTYGAAIVDVTSDGYAGIAVWVDLNGNGTADMIAIFDGPGLGRPIESIRVPAILKEGGCL